MIDKLKELKEKIIRGTTSETDVDTINEIITFMYAMEERAANIQEVPAQDDFCMEPFGGVNINIKNATVHIHMSENK